MKCAHQLPMIIHSKENTRRGQTIVSGPVRVKEVTMTRKKLAASKYGMAWIRVGLRSLKMRLVSLMEVEGR